MRRSPTPSLIVQQDASRVFEYLEALQAGTAMFDLHRDGPSVSGGVKVLREKFKSAWENTIENYRVSVGEQIDEDALAAADVQGFHSVLRHLYQGGDPRGMGLKANRLFKFVLNKSGNYSYKMDIVTLPDSTPSISEATGMNRRLKNFQASTERYAPFTERAAYMLTGQTVKGNQSSAEKGWYIIGTDPEATNPRQTMPKGTNLTLAPSFSRSFVPERTVFRDYFQRELSVTTNQMLANLDEDTKKGITSMMEVAHKMTGGNTTPRAALTGGKGAKSANVGKRSIDVKYGSGTLNTTMANRMAEAFARSFGQFNKYKNTNAPSPVDGAEDSPEYGLEDAIQIELEKMRKEGLL